jgi:hypothetical protein
LEVNFVRNPQEVGQYVSDSEAGVSMKILMPRKLVCQPLNNRVTSHKVLLSNGRVDPSLCSSTGHLGRLRQMAAISQSINQAINITFLSARLSPISASVS